MSNRSEGNGFEKELCDRLSELGWWAHNMAQNKAGQPADIIAVRNGVAVLIDAKLCSKPRFDLSRIEANQQGAMTLWKECGNKYACFAVKLPSGQIYMVSYDLTEMALKRGITSITAKDLYDGFFTLEEWDMEVRTCG
jgi:Holliday junction resolvase